MYTVLLISSDRVISYHIMLYHIISYHIRLYHSCHIESKNNKTYRNMSCNVIYDSYNMCL